MDMSKEQKIKDETEKIVAREERRAREREKLFFTHSIAEKVTEFEDVTFLEAMQILDCAKDIVKTNMETQKAAISPEIRDRWGTVIGTSGTRVPDVRQ